MKTKFSIFSQPNYLIRTAIEAECAVPILVCFYILCNNKSYKKASGLLRAEPLSSYFEDRRVIGEGNNQQRLEVKKVLSDKSVFPSLTTAPINDEAKKHNENLPGMDGRYSWEQFKADVIPAINLDFGYDYTQYAAHAAIFRRDLWWMYKNG